MYWIIYYTFHAQEKAILEEKHIHTLTSLFRYLLPLSHLLHFLPLSDGQNYYQSNQSWPSM